MSELPSFEIGEPSAELKGDFLELITSSQEFELDDGRTLNIEPPDLSYPCAMAVFYEKLPNAQGHEVAIQTAYIVDADSLTVEKSVTVYEVGDEKKPGDIAKFDQRQAKLDESVKRYESLGFTSNIARDLAFEVVVDESELLETVLDVIEADTVRRNAQKELGLDQVSGVELQGVVDIIRKAIQTISE